MKDTSVKPVAVLGLGSMGSALARAFAAAGHPTTVWNRTAAKTGPLVAAGAHAADSVAEAVAAGPLVVTCLTGFDETRAALEPAGSALVGKDLVTLNSGAPIGARETATWAVGHGARFLAGSVKDVPDAIGGPETHLCYSGDREVFDEHVRTLRVLGGDTVHLGDEPDLAAFYEMAVGGLMLPALLGFFQGAAAIQSRGYTAAGIVPHAEKGLDMIKAGLPGFADQIDRRDYREPSSTIDLFRTLEQAEHDLGQESGVDVTWQKPIWDRLRQASDQGYGDQEISAVTEILRGPPNQGTQ
ncbi:3-hydroxyisobutyrate dehydrogenase-like beta-hydroxyacid dehydrogenase [Murinocardiopsis flavida]|uniref:3-hydroxyisobutyrate dehydrogenase-like beta-hydroxyacid dehydrogenase n=1 Tax=Murinocardiopsis flavida TaxID=645275 RepID=A0A2P8DUY1_9ACTN|nr:NAD(P)-binding domain-containing protein [Murinocardiopsis flavida]PSL01015.1 3-hydroxyisobutyrate dehydrogenase-like beta-hydroxyacid dehydrogenase [Murinocardiopsis flavida]